MKKQKSPTYGPVAICVRARNSFKAEHQELIGLKCIERSTMEGEKGKRKIEDRGDEGKRKSR